VLTESVARWLLVLHTALGVAAVGAATHLVLWLRKYARGQLGGIRTVRKFAWITLALQLATFVAGNLMYPTYKVEIRTAYLENAAAIAAEHTARQQEVDRVAARDQQPTVRGSTTTEMVKRAAKAARWFDVKEHWVALGLIVCAALVLVLALWDPRRDGTALTPVITGLAWIVAGTLWLAAIIGVLTASWRAV
jgi:hypothetical protein